MLTEYWQVHAAAGGASLHQAGLHSQAGRPAPRHQAQEEASYLILSFLIRRHTCQRCLTMERTILEDSTYKCLLVVDTIPNISNHCLLPCLIVIKSLLDIIFLYFWSGRSAGRAAWAARSARPRPGRSSPGGWRPTVPTPARTTRECCAPTSWWRHRMSF